MKTLADQKFKLNCYIKCRRLIETAATHYCADYEAQAFEFAKSVQNIVPCSQDRIGKNAALYNKLIQLTFQ